MDEKLTEGRRRLMEVINDPMSPVESALWVCVCYLYDIMRKSETTKERELDEGGEEGGL